MQEKKLSGLTADNLTGTGPSGLNPIEFAKQTGATVVSMTGFTGGALRKLADTAFYVESDQYGVIEGMHMVVGSILAFYLKQRK